MSKVRSVDQGILEMKKYLDEGWSINIAKKKAFGSENNQWALAAMKTESYCAMLNEYCKSKGYLNFYVLKHGSLICVKKRKKQA
jgi:hypothetical protein